MIHPSGFSCHRRLVSGLCLDVPKLIWRLRRFTVAVDGLCALIQERGIIRTGVTATEIRYWPCQPVSRSGLGCVHRLYPDSAVFDTNAATRPMRLDASVVDRLTVQVVPDGGHDVFLSDSWVPGIAIERVGSNASRRGGAAKRVGPVPVLTIS